jgi:hypothetical protein
MIDLVRVSERPDALQFLYDLLAERLVVETISHQRFPTPEEHAQFLAGKPYLAHYIVVLNDFHAVSMDIQEVSMPVGQLYLSGENEIGLNIMMKYRRRRYGTMAINKLFEYHGYKSRDYYANISPYNHGGREFLRHMGFYPQQIVMKKG